MSNNGLIVTVVGWAATKPREVNGDGVPFTSFRVATTPRYFDKGQGAWADGRTEWLTVKVFRDVALNVAVSINKGDPVVVHGKLRTEEWQGENGSRSGMVVARCSPARCMWVPPCGPTSPRAPTTAATATAATTRGHGTRPTTPTRPTRPSLGRRASCMLQRMRRR